MSKMLHLSSEWGPSSRHLVQALNTDPESWENAMYLAIDTAADQLGEDPLQVLTSVTTLTHESTASPVLWVRPRNKVNNRQNFDAFIPDATRLSEAVHGALRRRTAVELASYFNIVSRNSKSRSLAGYIFESLVHSAITSSQPFAWYALDGSSETVTPTVTPEEVISGREHLKTTVTPFYFQPGLANYPGIDSALCTSETVIAIQATVSSKHTSALGGLRKLHSELPVVLRHQKENWCLLFAVQTTEQGRLLTESQREAVEEDSEWKNIKIGYFRPPHMQEFTAVVCNYILTRDALLIQVRGCAPLADQVR